MPVHSNIGTSEWRSWKSSFVALATNEGCATLARCDRISEYQWWTVQPRSGHSADVAGVLRWHNDQFTNRLILFIYLFTYLFVNLPVGAQLILLHLRGAQMTLAAFQEQFSFKFLPKTVIRQFWRSQCAWQRVPDPWSTHRNGTRTGSHCSRPRHSQFQMRHRTQKPTTRNRRNSDAVIGSVDGSATMATFVDRGGHLKCHPKMI